MSARNCCLPKYESPEEIADKILQYNNPYDYKSSLSLSLTRLGRRPSRLESVTIHSARRNWNVCVNPTPQRLRDSIVYIEVLVANTLMTDTCLTFSRSWIAAIEPSRELSSLSVDKRVPRGELRIARPRRRDIFSPVLISPLFSDRCFIWVFIAFHFVRRFCTTRSYWIARPIPPLNAPGWSANFCTDVKSLTHTSSMPGKYR